MAYVKIFEFTAVVRGYHYYRKYWNPEPEQVLNCYHERNNAFDRFAIKVCEIGNETPLGHLPMEISRTTKFLIDRGVTVIAELTSDHYRRSPLIQGGIEIPCKVTAKISGTVTNLLIIEKYRQLVQELYTEPKDKEILGSFLLAEANGNDLTIAALSIAPVPKIKKKPEVQMKDIQSFLIEIKCIVTSPIRH